MRNIKLTIAYDGTGFNGWQAQPGQPTIQGALANVLYRLTQERPKLQAAGRTDAGVHAWGQVASFKTRSEMPPPQFLRGFNALLPPAIRVREAEEVGPVFHPRWLARAKTYRYSIYRGPVMPPFRWRYALHDPRALDLGAMAEGARCFEGEHDFSSFSASSGSEEEDRERTMQRTIYRSEWISSSAEPGAGPPPILGFGSMPTGERECQEWVYIVRGKSFLRHMVRKMVGTLLEVGRGRLAPADIPRLLDLRDPSLSGPTAPPHGLCLASVEYSDPTASLNSDC